MVDFRMYIPRRVDIVWTNFNPQAGHEQTNKNLVDKTTEVR